jgi:hypothetical protein
MIPIIVYFGGDTINNAYNGIEYSIGLRLTIYGNENLTLKKLRGRYIKDCKW